MSATKHTPQSTKPILSLGRDPDLPNYAQYDGLLNRLCDFLGMQTGSTAGNYQAFKKLLNDQMNACASSHGVDVNGGKVAGCGVLGFRAPAKEPEKEEGMLL